jgi:hypothetical protein
MESSPKNQSSFKKMMNKEEIMKRSEVDLCETANLADLLKFQSSNRKNEKELMPNER